MGRGFLLLWWFFLVFQKPCHLFLLVLVDILQEVDARRLFGHIDLDRVIAGVESCGLAVYDPARRVNDH